MASEPAEDKPHLPGVIIQEAPPGPVPWRLIYIMLGFAFVIGFLSAGALILVREVDKAPSPTPAAVDVQRTAPAAAGPDRHQPGPPQAPAAVSSDAPTPPKLSRANTDLAKPAS